MPWLELLILGAGIGANNFAAALVLGSLGQAVHRWRILTVFGAFEFLVPLFGIWSGRQVAGSIAEHASTVAAVLIGAVGLWTTIAAQRRDWDEDALARRASSWHGLAVLASLLSIDNLLVGFGLGLGGRSPLLLASVIAVFAVAFAWIGLRFGKRLRRHHERLAETGAGIVLILLAAAMAADWL